VVGAPGYALRADHGNPESTEYLINPFAQLDAHNSLIASPSSEFVMDSPQTEHECVELSSTFFALEIM